MIPYRIIRSNRKTISLQITPSGDVLVRCPRRMAEHTIRTFVESREDWLHKHLAKLDLQEPAPAFTREELLSLKQQAAQEIPRLVAHFAPLAGVTWGRITIRSQHSRWGSCSARGNLNFNCLLMLTPPEVRNYVVVHELCHRKEMNHSPRFWAEVERVLPDYRQQKKWLKDNGGALIARLEKTSG